jgi:hypothetical protein
MPDPDPTPDAGSDDEQAELERLRAEVEELRAHQAELNAETKANGGNGAARPRRARRSLRWTACAILVVLASLLTIVAVVSRYARSQILDTDHYVATVGPLSENPAVERAIANQVTNEIFSRLDVEDLTQQALAKLTDLGAPEVIEGLAVPISSQVEGFVRQEVNKAVRSPRFDELWLEANRKAHKNVVAVLTGRGTDAVDVQQGKVTVDLGTIVERVKQRLVDRGFGFASRIPTVHSEFVLMQSDQLRRSQRAVRRLDRVATVLPIVVLALAAVAVFVAPTRRRGLIFVALGIAAGMVLLALALVFARNWYLDNGRPQNMTPQEAVGVIATLLAPLRLAMRAVLALALVVALGAFITGPSGAARGVRSFFGHLQERVQGRLEGDRAPSAVEAWIGGHKMALRIAVVGVAALLLAFWTYPTGAVVLGITLVVLVCLALIEVFGWTRPEPTTPAAG